MACLAKRLLMGRNRPGEHGQAARDKATRRHHRYDWYSTLGNFYMRRYGYKVFTKNNTAVAHRIGDLGISTKAKSLS